MTEEQRIAFIQWIDAKREHIRAEMASTRTDTSELVRRHGVLDEVKAMLEGEQ
jgi:hypothetical protein